MMATWMLYTATVFALIGVAAVFVERGLRLTRYPTRVVWIVAIGGSAALSVLAWFNATTPPVELDPVAAGGAAIIDPAAWAALLTVPESSSWGLDTLLAWTWGVASAGLALVLAFAYFRFRRESAGWPVTRIGGFTARVSPAFGPAVVGWFPATIVLPAWVTRFDASRRDLVFRHEREHVLAADAELLLAAVVAVVAMPWNLPLWWQLRRLRDAIEVDCDRRVVRAGADVWSYSELLLDVASRSARPRVPVPALSNPKSLLARRIGMMTSKPPRAPWTRAALAASAAVLLIAMACDTPMPAAVAVDETGAVTGVSSVMDVSQVDDQPQRMSGPVPRYPQMLREAGIEGTVLLEFLIDTEGRVDPASIEVLEATNRAFEAPASDVIAKSLYRPAMHDGEPVAVRAQQQIGFTIQTEGMSVVRRRMLTAETLASGEGAPVVYVDGVRADDGVPDLDPDAIERVEVIKGAAARAQYGEEGANGAILITTKRLPTVRVTGRRN